MHIPINTTPVTITAPSLLADIVGTNARFVLQTSAVELLALLVLPCNQYHTISDALHAYLTDPTTIAHGGSTIRHAAIAIANPVEGDTISMTNHHWTFSIDALRQEFQLETLQVVNDFTALAMSLPYLLPHQRQQFGGGTKKDHGVIGLIGAGTGLGVSGLIPAQGRWIPLESEGGHVTFAASNQREADIINYVRHSHPHVSAERLLSGIGLDLVYSALAERAGVEAQAFSVPEIVRQGLAKSCPVCEETLHAFCEMLATVASNLALTLGAKGGIYIGGGIVPRLGEFFIHSGFRQRFEQKGRLSAYLETIPTYVITTEFPA